MITILIIGILYIVTSYNDIKILQPKLTYPEEIKNHISEISKLSHQNNTYIFPRNGFLLGLIRHNGFLPNESIDPDLACLEKDVPKILNSDWGDYIVSAVTELGKEWDTDFFNGRHPITNKEFTYYNLKIRHTKTNFTETCMIYYELDNNKYIYPGYFIKSYNSKNEFKLNSVHYANTGGGLKIIHGGEIIPLRALYTNKRYLGKTYKIYDKSDFDSFYLEQFYDSSIYTPIGSCNILKADYGSNVFDVIINKDGSKETINY